MGPRAGLDRWKISSPPGCIRAVMQRNGSSGLQVYRAKFESDIFQEHTDFLLSLSCFFRGYYTVGNCSDGCHIHEHHMEQDRQ